MQTYSINIQLIKKGRYFSCTLDIEQVIIIDILNLNLMIILQSVAYPE